MANVRMILLTLGSIGLTSAVIGSAFIQKKQFYPTVIYLTKSNPSMAVLYLQGFVFVFLLAKFVGKIFFGQLRPAEMEHLVERAWYAITETCLAFTVFRDDFSSKFVALFTILLFFKCFHWLTEDRVDYMERSPVISWAFHVRVSALIILLGMFDMYFVSHAYNSTVQRGASVQLVFGFEYMILLVSLLAILLRYLLHTMDSQRQTPWDLKAMYMLYVDLIVGLLRLGLYLIFLMLMLRLHTFPLFIIRPVYLSVRAFKRAVQDVILSRRAIRYMNTVFPNATMADLQATDNVCIICREEMTGFDQPAPPPAPPAPGEAAPMVGSAGRAKKLPCGHMFHTACLRSWFQRQQTCPTCRMDILRTNQQAAAARPAATPAAQQQPAAPGAQVPAPPPIPPMLFPGLLGGPNPGALWMLRPPPGAVPPPAPPTTAAGPSGSPPASGSAQPPMAGMPPPSFAACPSNWLGLGPGPGLGMPPFFPAGMPELPNADLARVSDEELVRMEGASRAAVEARLACLRRVQVLLDAAVLQMHAYVRAVGSGPVAFPAPSFTSTSPLISAAAESDLSTAPAPGPADSPSAGENEDEPATVSTVGEATSLPPTSGDVSPTPVPAETASEQADQSEEGDGELHVLRQRRLQRFQPADSNEQAAD